jgi:hypothetical protein
MKLKESRSQLSFDAFEYGIHLVFSDDVVASRTKRDGFLGKYDGGPAGGLHSYTPDGSYSYLFLRFNANPSVIAHEAWHCIRRMMVYCGAELENEVVAYHLGYLVGFIHERQKLLQPK